MSRILRLAFLAPDPEAIVAGETDMIHRLNDEHREKSWRRAVRCLRRIGQAAIRPRCVQRPAGWPIC